MIGVVTSFFAEVFGFPKTRQTSDRAGAFHSSFDTFLMGKKASKFGALLCQNRIISGLQVMMMPRKRISVSMHKNTDRFFSFDVRLAREIGVHEACVLAVLLKYRAYDGPVGRRWVKMLWFDWEDELWFLRQDQIREAILNLYERNDVLIPACDVAFLKHQPDFSRCYGIEYLISPQRIFIDDALGGFVYLYQMKSIFKVGMTRDLKARYQKLCASLPYTPSLWAYCVVSDRYWAERAFHLMWQDKSVKGRGAGEEWFDLAPPDLAFFLHCARYRTATPIPAYEYMERMQQPFSLELADWQLRFEDAAHRVRPQQHPRPMFSDLVVK